MTEEEIVRAKNGLFQQKIRKQKALKIPKITDPKLRVEESSSIDFSFNVERLYYNGSSSKRVREALRNITSQED